VKQMHALKTPRRLANHVVDVTAESVLLDRRDGYNGVEVELEGRRF
jgi:hypothetical protein